VTFSSVTVNGQPARMLQGNAFETTLEAQPGVNTVTVEATDFSGNVTTQTYEVEVTGAGASYTYDANGNLATKVDGGFTWGYEWNALNQLTRVTKDTVELARFAYDPLGRRIRKVAGGTTTSYTYAREDILREVRGGVTSTYVHGPGIDSPLARDTAGVLAYYHADGLGSVVAETDAAGAVASTRRYDAWGNLHVGASDAGYAFTGREWDPETGLYYYRARYYDPALGVFVSQDPIGPRLSQTLRIYVGANPINRVDPMGEDGIDFSAGLGDALLLGFGDEVRSALGTGDLVDKCSPWYRAGGWASFALGLARLGYAAAAKGLSIAASSGAAASAGRAQLKNIFRLGIGRNWRPPNLINKTDAALRASAGRTNLPVNLYGAGVAAAGAREVSRPCECE